MDAQALSEAMGDSLPMSRYEALAPAFNQAMINAGITTALRAAHWCSQLGHESAGLRYMEEIASGAAYEGRADLGNTQAGDGVRFKGRGPIQVTGRANYTACSKWANDRGLVPTATYFVDNPAQLASDTYGFIGPVWYWVAARPGLNALCDADDTVGVTKAINGGTNGLADRQDRLARCKTLGERLLPTETETAMITPNPDHRGDPLFLPELLRAWGLTVREMDGWTDWGCGDFTDIIGVMCHHTAGATTSPEYIARNPGLGTDLSAQMHLARDGVVTLCGAGIAWHAGGSEAASPAWCSGQVQRRSNGVLTWMSTANGCMLAVEAVNAGDGTQDWPEVQLAAYATICAAVCWYLGLSVDRVIGHKEFAPSRKIDPNFDMAAFRRRVQTRLTNPPTEDTMGLTQEEHDALMDCRAMLQDISAQRNGDPAVSGPYGGWDHDKIMTNVAAKRAAGKDLTNTEQLHVALDLLGFYRKEQA